MYTAGMGDFTTGDRYWIEEDDQKKKKKRLTEVFFLSSLPEIEVL